MQQRLALLFGLFGLACGTGPSHPASPESTVNVVAFYDENANGLLDAEELVRFPGATVDVGALSGDTQAEGEAAVHGVPAGMTPIGVADATLPPYYASAALTVQVPQEAATPVAIPVNLPIGANTPNLYMAFGDSITVGDGSSYGSGYRGPLQSQLRQHFEAADSRCNVRSSSPAPAPASPPPDPCPIKILDEGEEATRSLKGAERIAATFAQTSPAFVLVHYGTNDWNEAACRDAPPCYTISSLKTIVETIKGLHGYPFLATIIPVNVGYDQRVPPERDVWVHNQDMLIRQLAAEEGVVLVDLEAAFRKAFADNGGDYQAFFTDHVHPNDLGYAVMVKAFYAAVIARASPPAAADAFGPWGAAHPAGLPFSLARPRQRGATRS